VLCSVTVVGYPLAVASYGPLAALPSDFLIIALRFLLPPLLLPFAGLMTILGIAAAVGILTAAFVFLLVELPLLLVDYFNDRSQRAHIRRKRQEWLLTYVQRFRLWLFGQQLPPMPDDSKGARFATNEEIAALHTPRAPESMAFGHDGAPLFLKTEKHILIMASTRSGKGVSLIIPHLLRYQGSAFILDPKGENAKATGRRRAQLNQEVHYLDPFGISGKPPSRFNPFTRFTPENIEAEAKALAAAMFLKDGGKGDHWEQSGEKLFTLLIMFAYLSPDIRPQQKDLHTVRKLLLGPLRHASDMSKGREAPPPAMLDTIAKMEDESGLMNDLAASFLRIPEKEFGSILSTATRQTEILDNPQVIATLRATGAGSEVDFARWHKGTMTVYLCLSAPKFPTFNRWLRLILTAALDEMTDKLDPPRLPVCFMLDELATLGHLQSVENAVGLAAGYGVQLVTVFQDVAQMKELYKGRWASFIGNAGIRALFNLDDFDSALYWSKFMGNCLDESHGRHEDAYGLSDGENIGEVTRPLISPEKIMMDFAKGQMLVLAQGAHPILTTRTPYYQDATLAGLWDDPRAKAKPSQPAQPRGALSWLAPEAPAPVQKVSPPPPLEPEPAENLQNMMDELLGRPSNKNDKND
jgi:type IV secretion system protein VirD4